MKSLLKSSLVVVMALGLSVAGMSSVLAGEHGGKEHGGSKISKGHSKAETLLEAAHALKKTNPKLAMKLKKMAKEM